MAKKLLQLIAEAQLENSATQNIVNNSYIQNSEFSGYIGTYGTYQGVEYLNDTNSESRRVAEIGRERLIDVLDLNIQQPDSLDLVNLEYNNVSVQDNDSIDEISEGIYNEMITSNRFFQQGYEALNVELLNANNNIERVGRYDEYISPIVERCKRYPNNIARIFIGDFNEDDSQIGVIGAQSLNRLLNVQLEENIRRETIGRVETNLFNFFQSGRLLRRDYEITVNPERLGATAEFLLNLQGVQVPFSYIPDGIFGNELRTRQIVDGNEVYFGSGLSFEDRLLALLRFTSRGQQSKIFEAMDINKYNPALNSQFGELAENEYVDYIENFGIIAKSLNVTSAMVPISNEGYYEKYGVIDITKKSNTSKMLDDEFVANWNWDVDPSVVGWNIESENNFNPNSILYKTKQIVDTVNGAYPFIRLNDKEYIQVVDGETNVISRGDATTASGAYVDDDGTEISRGEFFRVWTKNRGYNRLARTLRHRGLDNGDKRSVLNDNGLINFAPTIRNAGNINNNLVEDDIIKRYMFSIENLAWADNLDDLPLCEQGTGDPTTGNRGRIMWFPPYNLDISESVQASYEAETFMGRGEPTFTYNHTTRSANLSFSIIVDHPDIVHTLVGERTQFWERYFKGDKLVENEAIVNYILNQKLSPNELNELNNLRKVLKPKQKFADEVKITPSELENEVIDKTVEVEESGELGELLMSVYFPNDVVVVPRSIFKNENTLIDATLVVDNTINFSELKQKNVGYEDDGLSDQFGLVTSDGYRVSTESGIKYIKNNRVVNKGFTYKGGVLKDRLTTNQINCTQELSSSGSAPVGYPDRNNFGLNSDFYYFWQLLFTDKLKNAKRAKVFFVGNASGALPTTTTNNSLSSRRANNVKDWFENNVPTLFDALSLDVEFSSEVTFKGNEEDLRLGLERKELLQSGDIEGARAIEFCDDCDEADYLPCKKTRRVDIYVKILEENEPDEPIIVPSGGTTIEDTGDDDDLTVDDDEDNNIPEVDEILPNIDPNILSKLVYTECDFFQYLETNEPLIYKTISERIKYFMPAYHSITPQGLNSRLTFLQQCLRQGDTLGIDGVENWKNLAFGRTPVCILRIGDFYHTKVIVESLDITYGEGMNWDMNPEGIGVQPMYVDISMGLKIIGGSSMTAPIKRLQNAMSFNYYANTEMYDARADSVLFESVLDEDGNVDAIETFGREKAAKIVDGIRLSSLAKYTDIQQKERLANIRNDSRVALSNSTTTLSENQSDLGVVESLLETKKRLGLPLSEIEKVQVKGIENTNGKFEPIELDQIQPSLITINDAKNSLVESIKIRNTALNLSAQDFIADSDNGVYFEVFNQFISASVDNPEELSDEYKLKMGLEYLDAYRATWYDDDGNLINIE